MKRMICASIAVSLLTASAAHAAGVDYYLKIPPIKGESEAMAPGVESDEIDSKAAAPATTRAGDITLRRGVADSAKGGNVETEFKVEKGEKADGDPDRPLTTGRAAADNGHKDWIELISLQQARSAPATGQRTAYRSRPARQRPEAPGNVAAPGKDTVAIGLLLPAVQKVRVAAARTPAWPGCAAGQELPGVEIMEASTGRTGRILDATVSQCASEQVSFNFTKIEWD